MELKTKVVGLSNDSLKIIAMVCMLVDHVGMILLPQCRILRIVGRVAFPIFAYMIAEGCSHTRDRSAYLRNVALLALLCQCVYTVALRSLFQCAVVTFTLSIVTIYCVDALTQRRGRLLPVLGIAAVAFLCLGAPVLLRDHGFAVDYGALGVLLPVAVYYARGRGAKLLCAAVILVGIGVVMGGIQGYALLALPLLALYNGERGTLGLKYLFYIFYPAHLAVLYLISMVLPWIG